MHQSQTDPSEVLTLKSPWFRANDGILAGVCAGVARKLNLDPWLVRIGLLVSVLLFGAGVALYLVLAVSLPKENQLASAHRPRLLGVCARVSESLQIDVGLVRAITVLIGLGSMGATLLAYVILHFVVDGRPHISAARPHDLHTF